MIPHQKNSRYISHIDITSQIKYEASNIPFLTTDKKDIQIKQVKQLFLCIEIISEQKGV